MALGDRRSTFRVAVVKRALGGDRRGALVEAVRGTEDGIDLVVLPYLGAYPLFWGTLDRGGYRYAERAPFPTLEAVREAARQRGVAVAVSFYEAVGEGVFYATVALVGPDGGVQGTYRQAHALNRDAHREQLFFQPGTTGRFPVFAVGSVRIGFLLGGDLWVPEAARILALGGADVLIASAGIDPDHGSVDSEIISLVATRAMENCCGLVFANRSSGATDGWAFLANGNGAIAMHSRTEDRVHTVEVDLALIARLRATQSPIRLRRPRLYGPLASGDEGSLP
jgi:N-carbamoylputrescine amidase